MNVLDGRSFVGVVLERGKTEGDRPHRARDHESRDLIRARAQGEPDTELAPPLRDAL